MRTALSLAALLLVTTSGLAFPPAPHYTLYGMVRDQVGQTVTAEGAEVVLLRGTKEVGRAPITTDLELDENYRLNMRLDTLRSNTTLYTSTAVQTGGVFSLAVDIQGVRYYPIEVAGTLTAGKGGERVRLDLNLGEDTDGDGLPDIWEQWQLYQAGLFPGANGWDLSLLNRNGDFDKDGLSDWLEYVAGTFAGDATERFTLDIKEKTATQARLEFYAITGKTYTIERSTDLKTWARVPFALTAGGAAFEVHRAEAVSIQPAYTTPATTTAREFYRLTVR